MSTQLELGAAPDRAIGKSGFEELRERHGSARILRIIDHRPGGQETIAIVDLSSAWYELLPPEQIVNVSAKDPA